MRYDVIIIGGGHSGLEEGIRLQKEGQKCLAVSVGESAHRFVEQDYSHRDAIKEFEEAGGTFLKGDRVVRGDYSGNAVIAVYTKNHGETPFVADRFIISTGSFFSGGLVAGSTEITEPVFGLDVNYEGTHSDWVKPDFFADQPFMHFGVRTDEKGRAFKNGEVVANLFVKGSIAGK